MTPDQARKIILHAVTTTQPRWLEASVHWKDMDKVFLNRAYEQGGFEVYKFIPLLGQRGIGTIPETGRILLGQRNRGTAYNRSFAGSLDAPFWKAMTQGDYGINGQKFVRSVEQFLIERPGKAGAFFWRQIWNLLNACAFFTQQHQGSFSVYVKAQVAQYLDRCAISDADLLNFSAEEWQVFVSRTHPYKAIQGVGPNVFDFLMRDIAEARFTAECFKFDSANQHFLNVTGISDLIVPFDRNTVIDFIRSLNLPYKLKTINCGIYVYCSETEARDYGFCRSSFKCHSCGIKDLCLRRV